MTPWRPAGRVEGPQDLEDLATACWLSEVLFAALDLGLFEALGGEAAPLEDLACRCGADPGALERLVRVLSAMGLVSLWDGRVACTGVARRHLLREGPAYLGHSLAYRRRLARSWPRLAEAVRKGGSPLAPPGDEAPGAYRARVRDYVLAMDDVARHKARLIADRLDLARRPRGAVLDLGGGAGALAAELVRRRPGWTAVVAELPEVVEVARHLWAGREGGQPRGLRFAAVELLSEPLPGPPAGGWDVVLASNVVHAYGPGEAGDLVRRAARDLAPEGVLVLHDFWTDGPGRGPLKAAVFDLHMLVHTYQGRTYPWEWARRTLEDLGLRTAGPIPLGDRPGSEDTALVVGAPTEAGLSLVRAGLPELLDAEARALGLGGARELDPAGVVVAGWVREKCRFGCSRYARGGRCPPRAPSLEDTRATLAGYRRALLVLGEPPARDFQERMLALERAAFLRGAVQALALPAGPCSLCAACRPDDCPHPDRARPSMEACGIDVYATARAAGVDLAPVKEPGDPVRYVGLLLVD